MKVALVHDYLNEYGGAEKVLGALSEMFPNAPIYTAFYVSGSSAYEVFKHRKIVGSWFMRVPFYWKLFSPLRFLIPWIWKSFDLTGYDVIISSASWYVTKGFDKKPGAIEICYCHTPPRWLYGYSTSVDMKKFWIVRVYAAIVGHFLRMYDFNQAQKVDVFVANSKNVAGRIKKFYRREAKVIYPPVNVSAVDRVVNKEDFYLIVSRLVGGKGIQLAVEAANKYGLKLKVAGEMVGWGSLELGTVETLGRVSEEEKFTLMAQARGFLALARDEDFGITPVEAMGQGTPVIAYKGGGYTETVIDGKTGVLFEDYSALGLMEAVKRFEKIKWKKQDVMNSVKNMTNVRFKDEINALLLESRRTFE